VDAVLGNVGWLVFGLALLSFGADWLVKGASQLALRAGVTPLVIGLTVVAFGTSAPELIVSLKANLDPETRADIAVGNVIGSNICNIALLLGLAGLIRPMTVSGQVVKRELPILLGVTALFVAMILDRRLETAEGWILATGIVLYVVFSIRLAKKHPGDVAAAEAAGEYVADERPSVPSSVLWLVLGLAGLLFGADRLVESGVELAELVGVPQVVIGLTLVAIGTSLPELATTVAASRRGETELITGNLIGSNLFNIMAVMGITAVAKPISLAALNWVDVGVMCAATLLLVPFLLRGRVLARGEGAFLVVGYLVYCVYLVKPAWLGL